MNKVIKKLDPKKAAGVDKTLSKEVKISAKVVRSHIPNKILNDFSEDCFSEKNTSIFKKKERVKSENYRPDSICNCV